MNYGSSKKSIVNEFIRRTKENRRIIEEADGGYEVTQCINSLLGLLIIPQESVVERLIDDDLIDVSATNIYNGFMEADVDNLKDFIKFLRNSVAHYGISFGGLKEIETITFEGYLNSIQHKATFNIDAFIEFVDMFTDELCTRIGS